MNPNALGKRFLETTRGQVVAMLRRRAQTVEELAKALELTDNAIRGHLATLERDGLVRSAGVRRGPGAGKPAVIYEIHPDAEPLFSRAYPAVLTTVVDVLTEHLSRDEADSALREVGRRLARDVGGRATGDTRARMRTAAAVLVALGGDVEIEETEAEVRLRGCGCPLSATVARRPETCRAVESLVSEIVGTPVRQCCEHGPRPRCGFAVNTAA